MIYGGKEREINRNETVLDVIKNIDDSVMTHPLKEVRRVIVITIVL